MIKNRILLIIGLSLIMIMGCEDIVDPDYVSPEDSSAAITAVNEANASLEILIYDVLNADADSVQQMLDLLDFSASYALFVEAHELDPRNNEANFGLAFTGFMTLSQDTQLQEMLLRWESYFKLHPPFEGAESQSGLAGFRFGTPFSVDGIIIPTTTFIATPLALSRMSLDDVPQFSEFQDLVASLFLPVISESITALEIVEDDPDFVFLISGQMQGDTEADPLELDLTEVYALQTGLYALQGVLNTVVAYNFDFVSFDSSGIVTELSQGSDFATLKSGGAASLLLAKNSAETAFVKALAALAFLEAESDDQTNDIIVLDGEDPAEIEQMISEAQMALNEPTMVHYEYWSDIYEDDEWMGEVLVEDSIYVDVSQFFEDPILDFKAMLPPYTMNTTIDYEYISVGIIDHFHAEDSQIAIAGLDNSNITINFSYDEYSTEPMVAWVSLAGFYINLVTASQDQLPPSVWELYAEFEDLVAEYSGELYRYPSISFYWDGSITTGTSLIIDGNVNIYYEERGTAYVEPDPQWDATTYAEWLTAWPDPTMHGIFPDMDATGLAEFLGFNEDNWEDFSN